MMPKRRTKADYRANDRARRAVTEALVRRKHKPGMTKEEFRRKLMEDLGYGQIYD
jgi:hypothetical protein